MLQIKSTERDIIYKQIHKLSLEHRIQMKKATRLAKETMVKFRQKIDESIETLIHPSIESFVNSHYHWKPGMPKFMICNPH